MNLSIAERGARHTPMRQMLNKVPEVALSFWIIKVLATTVGETVADFLSVGVGFGTAVTDAAMASLLAVALVQQMRKDRYTPWVYWLTVVLVSVVGTQITDMLTDGLGISLYWSTGAFSVALAVVFALWYRHEKTLSIHTINTFPRELFYWVAILCTFALGTAAGDLATEALALGFQGGVFVFAGLIAAIAGAYYMGASPVLTFWLAYILTRPLGAAFGDLLTQPQDAGGIGLGAMWTSAIFLSVILTLVTIAQRQASQEASHQVPDH